MVHIKLSTTFVLAAAAIALVVAQPIRQPLSRREFVDDIEVREHPSHRTHSDALNSSPATVSPLAAPSQRESVDGLGIRELTPAGNSSPATSTSAPEVDEQPGSTGLQPQQPPPSVPGASNGLFSRFPARNPARNPSTPFRPDPQAHERDWERVWEGRQPAREAPSR